MNIKRILKIVFTTLILISIFVVCYKLYPKNQDYKKHIDVKKEVESIVNDTFTSEDVTKKELEKEIGTYIPDSLFVLGTDSYINSMPSEGMIKKYKLEKYVTKQEKLAKRITDEFKTRFKYELGSIVKEKDIQKQRINIITMYYGLYQEDLNFLVNKGMEYKNYEISKIERSEKLQAQMYKIKVLAMEILDSNFDIYKNINNERVTVEISYKDGRPADDDQLFTLLCNINGLTYPNAFFTNEENVNLQNERINVYLPMLKNKLDKI